MPYVTVHDGFDNTTPVAAGLATKCWPLQHWADLVRSLKSRMPELGLCKWALAKSRAIAGVDVDLVDRTSLQQAAWILKNALLHIDTDSGLVHVARAVHTPVVALFGPTDVAYYGYATAFECQGRRVWKLLVVDTGLAWPVSAWTRAAGMYAFNRCRRGRAASVRPAGESVGSAPGRNVR